MAYKVIILYQLYMPSYFLGTFTEYPYFNSIPLLLQIHPKQPGYPNKELKVLFSRLQQNKNSNTTHTKLIITVSTLPHNRIPGCSIVRNHLRNPDAIIPAVLPAQSGKYILSFWFPPEYLPSAQLF